MRDTNEFVTSLYYSPFVLKTGRGEDVLHAHILTSGHPGFSSEIVHYSVTIDGRRVFTTEHAIPALLFLLGEVGERGPAEELRIPHDKFFQKNTRKTL